MTVDEQTREHETTDRFDIAGPHGMAISLDAAGHVNRIGVEDLQVNLFVPALHDRPAEGVWLRRRRGSGAESVHLNAAADSFGVLGDRATWSGEAFGVRWRLDLRPTGSRPGVQWDVHLSPAGASAHDEFDLVLVQDVALVPAAMARGNELYASHYVAHELLRTGDDLAVASRQTMAVAPRLPLALTRWIGGARAASTDAFDFEGVSCRTSQQPEWLSSWDWPTRVRQYEHSQVALASSSFSLTGPLRRSAVLTVVPDYRGPLAESTTLAADPEPPVGPVPDRRPLPASALANARQLNGDPSAEPDPDSRFVESDAEGPLSWFAADGSHVVTGRKESLVERSHGHILVDCADLDISTPTLSATCYAPGVFASMLAYGNSTAHRVLGVHRDSLNLLRSSGLRILVGTDDGPLLLGVPTLLRIGWGEVEWLYRTPAGRIKVSTVIGSGEPVLRVHVEADRPLRLLATLRLDADTGPWDAAPRGEDLHVVPGEGHPARALYPGLRYRIVSAGGWRDDSALWSDARPRDTTMWMTGGRAVTDLDIVMTASLDAAPVTGGIAPFDAWSKAQRRGHRDFRASYTADLNIESGDARLQELAEFIPWLAHDALVHLRSPHGLEQFSGAAWGTRDVCQGPLELALTLGHEASARDMLVRVFEHQFATGDWPQWFMFDAYPQHQADSHGDVPVWPLIALGEYLGITGDMGILDETVRWMDSTEPQAIATHVGRVLDHIESHTVPGTGLYAFGEGDWDDTLQPADPAQREGMVSTWTIGLVVEACERLGLQLRPVDPALAERCAGLGSATRAAYASHLIVDGVVPGLVRFGDSGPDYLIHPRDRRTGQHYRLISLTQAILADLLPDDISRETRRAVAEHLSFADGVRLADEPMPWREGVPRIFRRGEQSAFFGREVGLMYTHAHLRWVQALTHVHDPRALDRLLDVVPVGLHDRLGDLALPRQRNCYYSSSDARFLTRTQASEDWGRLREGRVPVAGGWRVYSSGPGIVLRLIVRELLGIRIHGNRVEVRPDLPADIGPLSVGMTIHGRRLRVRYAGQGDDAAPDGPDPDVLELTVSGVSDTVPGVDLSGDGSESRAPSHP